MNIFSVPILFIVFNRPDTTGKVFSVIKELKPRYLFIAMDGPRENNHSDIEKCKSVQMLIDNGITWDCEVKKLQRDKNLGCGQSVSTAIDWFFSHVDRGIILEDDTLPHSSFFGYCEALLTKYENDESVMHISGCNFFKEHRNPPVLQNDSYYFSKHVHVWGWATWKRAWKFYDYNMPQYSPPQKALETFYGPYHDFWRSIYQDISNRAIDTWDYQWMYAIFLQKGLAINPTKNLILNIGFGSEATHTKDANLAYGSVVLENLPVIVHPKSLKVNHIKDQYYYSHFLGIKKRQPSMYTKLKTKFREIIRDRFYDNKTLTGISSNEFVRLNSLDRYVPTETKLFGRKIKILDASTFLSSFTEIFSEQIYKFVTNTAEPIIIDCGANIGLATLYFKTVFPAASVFAFEPDRNLYEALVYNVNSFQFDKVVSSNTAVSDNNADLLFKMEGGHSGMLVDKKGNDVVIVKATRLKDFLSNFSSVSFLKIDIEGHEDKVLVDIENELKKVDNLFVEYHSFIGNKQELGELLNLLTSSGFRYYIKEGSKKAFPFIQRELFLNMDMTLNIFCFK